MSLFTHVWEFIDCYGEIERMERMLYYKNDVAFHARVGIHKLLWRNGKNGENVILQK